MIAVKLACFRKHHANLFSQCGKFLLQYRLRASSSSSTFKDIPRYKVHIIPALTDNYMYILADKLRKVGIAVDPVEPNKVLNLLEREKLNLSAVLTTHHHFDHAGGNKMISETIKDIPIYGLDERIESITNKVSPNEIIKIGDFAIKCLHTPCHTSGHVCYYVEEDAYREPICFTGDTLFVSGCGRFFEGSAEDMLHSLSLLSALPLHTKFYCGHEYTLSNLKFALSVEPENEATIEKLKLVEEKLRNGEPSVPSTIGEEFTYNPFLRTAENSIQSITKETEPVAVMTVLRKLKDSF